MRKTLFYLFCFIACAIGAKAQTIRTPVAAPFLRVNTYSKEHANAFSFTANQAALASINNFSAGLYSERRFMLKELSFYSAAVAMPTSSGNFGLQGNYFGYASSNETGLGLAYGRSLGDKVAIGVQFNYYSYKIAGYGSASSVNAEGGVLLHLTDALSAGLHVYNPTGIGIGKSKEEKLPAIFSVGFGYDVSKKFFIGAEAEKIEDQPLNVNVGAHYYFDAKLFASAGMASAASSYYFGFGVAWQTMQLNAVASFHPQLGVTPGLMLVFCPSKKQSSE